MMHRRLLELFHMGALEEAFLMQSRQKWGGGVGTNHHLLSGRRPSLGQF